MTNKAKSLSTILLLLSVAALLSVFITLMGNRAYAASAATYSDSGIYELDMGAEMKITTNATGVPYYVYLCGNSTSSTKTKISSGALFSFKPTKIEVIIPGGSSSSYHYFYGRVYDVSLNGPVSFSFSNVNNGSTAQSTTLTYTLSGLTDGKYTFSFTKDEHYHAQTNPGGTTDRYNPAQTFSFEFTVDGSPPVIEGASPLESVQYTNSAFTVTATDAGSGVRALYMKPPSGSTREVGTSITISKGSENGQYRFYAVDNLGNTSNFHYVNFDDTAPSLNSYGTDFGTSTNSGFTVTATDNLSSPTLYYRHNTGSWQTSGSSFTLSDSAADGTYSFYAEDKAGNRSYEQWIQVGMDLTGRFVKSDSDNSVYFTWERATWTATLDGRNYTKGTWIKEEGEHTITLISGEKNALFPYTIDHYYIESVSQADCTHSGYAEYDCVQCGSNYVKTLSEELGHYYVASTVAQTCNSGGYTIYTCTRCGDSYRDNETPKLGHNYVQEQISPTCTDSGYTLYSCTRCDFEYRSGSTQPTGHSYIETTYPATCTEGSYTLHECSICGNSYRDNISQPLGHNFLTYTEPPTCTESGKIVSTCQVCNYTEDKSDGSYPLGHDYTVSIVKSATCTEEGTRRMTCDTCGNYYEERIHAQGHSYEITDTQSTKGITTRTYTCSVCGDSYKQELGDQYEQVSNYVEYLFDEYSPYMIWVFLATAGVWSIAIGIAFIIAQKNEDKEKAKKMLINYVVGLVVIFAILVAAPYLIRGIAALVT